MALYYFDFHGPCAGRDGPKDLALHDLDAAGIAGAGVRAQAFPSTIVTAQIVSVCGRQPVRQWSKMDTGRLGLDEVAQAATLRFARTRPAYFNHRSTYLCTLKPQVLLSPTRVHKPQDGGSMKEVSTYLLSNLLGNELQYFSSYARFTRDRQGLDP